MSSDGLTADDRARIDRHNDLLRAGLDGHDWVPGCGVEQCPDCDPVCDICGAPQVWDLADGQPVMRLTSQPVTCLNGMFACPTCGAQSIAAHHVAPICGWCAEPHPVDDDEPPPTPHDEPIPRDEWAEEHWGSAVALIPIPF